MQKRIIIKTEYLIILIHNMHFYSYSFSCGPIKAPWCMIRHERIYKVCVCGEKKNAYAASYFYKIQTSSSFR